MTILPAFLIPYSTVFLPALEKAVQQYCFSGFNSMTEAAMTMHCENPKSFSLYFKRITININRWLIFLVCLISDISQVSGPDMNNTIVQSSTSHKWQILQILLTDYFTVIQKNPHAPSIGPSAYFSAFHAKLVRNQMGLGP
jgi:hypothetical protein